MSLGAIIDRVDAAERRLTLVSPPSDDVVNAVERTFGPQGVSVEVREGTDQSVAVVHDGDEVIRIVPLVEGGSGLAAATDAVTDALSTLERTTFTSYGLRGMFAATREIEDRAWRVRRGRLRAGFQQVDALEQQKQVYRHLASALEVHAYAAPAVSAPDLGDAIVHLDPADEIARSWFVVYDGDGDPAHKCALVAEERGERTFAGFLTYEPSLVDEVDDYLSETY